MILQFNKKSIIVTITGLSLALSAGIATTTHAEVTRLSGANRYLTSDAIVKAGWPKGAKVAVLASGLDDNEVDALTVAPLAKDKDAPIVLVNPKDSVSAIVAKFTALSTKTVYIANGTGVISTKVEAGLKAAGISTVYRLGGANRYETARNIAEKLDAQNSIVVASGKDANLVDSLSIAPIAAAKGMPIFLAGSSLDAATTNYINGLGVKATYVLGGTGAVSDHAVKALPRLNRLGGSGRYETNAKVVDTFKTDAALNLNNIFIASGEDANLIDSLAVGSLAGSIGAPIVFVDHTINPAVNTLLKSIVNKTTKITILGGTSAVTASIQDAINKIQKDASSTSGQSITEKIRNYIFNGQENKPEADKIKWSKTFLNRVDIESLYKQYLAKGGRADDLKSFATYITLNAPIPSDWQELFKKDLYDTYGEKVVRLEHLEGDLYQAYIVINGSEKPYVAVSSRTGYFHG